jgi:hypothetical protein
MSEGTQPLFSELVCDPTKEFLFQSESEASQKDVACVNLNRKTQQAKPKAGSPFLVILTTEQARAIYRLRSASTAEGAHAKSVAGKSSLVAEMFGVSPKTIRDVWNRKTWTQVSLRVLSF